jgi:hypothetical protein
MIWRPEILVESDDEIDFLTQKFLEEQGGLGNDPWHTYDHDFKDERSAPWYRALYKIYIHNLYTDFFLLKNSTEPPEEMLPHIQAAYDDGWMEPKANQRPKNPSIFRKDKKGKPTSERFLAVDYELDKAEIYAKKHGVELKTLLHDEEKAAHASKDDARIRTIHLMLSRVESRRKGENMIEARTKSEEEQRKRAREKSRT